MAADALTAYLLACQVLTSRSVPLLVLAATYEYTALTIGPHLAAFPGVVSAAGFGSSQSAIYLWFAWHAGFPLGLSLYFLSGRRPWFVAPAHVSRSLFFAAAAILVFVCGSAGIALGFGRILPPLIVGTHFNGIGTLGLGAGVVGLNVVALLLATIPGSHERSALRGWLMVATAASLFDALLTLASGSRYSLGWYAGRIESLVTAGMVLAAFLWQMTKLYNRAAVLAVRDPLTQVSNRRGFESEYEQLLADCERRRQPLHVLIIDIDHFKAYNDRYGHLKGDVALHAVARAIASSLRAGDICARLGGEEFAVVLAATDAGAKAAARRIIIAVEALGLVHEASPHRVVTVSVGIAGMAEPRCSENVRLLAAADRAVYVSKRAGRNRFSELGRG